MQIKKIIFHKCPICDKKPQVNELCRMISGKKSWQAMCGCEMIFARNKIDLAASWNEFVKKIKTLKTQRG